MAPKILKFFLVVFDIYTQPWTKLQNEIQKFCFFRTGYGRVTFLVNLGLKTLWNTFIKT